MNKPKAKSGKKTIALAAAGILTCTGVGAVFGSTDAYAASGPLVNGISAFPESYKEGLKKLAQQFPNWKFAPDKTNLDWNQVVDRESGYNGSSKINLVHKTHPDQYKSYDPRDYDQSTGTHKEYDSNGWVGASKGIVAYYMDPRNFLDPQYIFQFMTVKYDASVDYKSALNTMLSDTFLNGTVPDSPSKETYAAVLMRTGENLGVNPLVLAAMILQEQGKTGYGHSITGIESGYEGLYNYFNIGAVKGSGRTAVQNGLVYARSKGWTNRTKSIEEGAGYFAEKYVKRNQDTLYLKKFNVMNGASAVGTWQYMTNVAGAANEGLRMSKAFNESNSTPLLFEIPVYENMPDSPAPKPTTAEKAGWVKEDGHWKYGTAGNYVAAKWLKISGKWYYFNGSGYAVTGWQHLDGKDYYFNSDCQMVTGNVTIDGKQYSFHNTDGQLLGKVDDQPKPKEDKAEGNNPQAVSNGWFKDSQGTWYYGKDGHKATGWVKDAGTWYYMGSSGAMATGWVKDAGTWYYMGSSGAMATGWVKDAGTWYYMGSSGAMATGWVKVAGTWYYFNGSGQMVTGDVNIGGYVYRFNGWGAWLG